MPAKRPTRKKSAPKRVKATPEYAATLYDRLAANYPDAHCALDFTSPFQLIAATILSAQCTDKRVNMVTPELFKHFPTPAALAAAQQEDVEEIIKSAGFFRSKAKSLIGMATAITERHGGRVPNDMASLVALPGVGRKTANVVLGNAYDINEGIVVDTHVSRVTQRLGLTKQTDPVKIEQDLVKLFPRDRWTLLSHLLIEHGRRLCNARRPECEVCFLNDLCPSSSTAKPLAPARKKKG
ncbi:MAG: endonuclease III [Gemmatimonadaceae bacterium]